MKWFNYAVTFKSGLTTTGTNHQAEDEKDMIQKIISDKWNQDQVILSLTVVEKEPN